MPKEKPPLSSPMSPSADTSAANKTLDSAIAMADAAFLKLPALGPIAWLYARNPERRFLFLADLDWAVMPPLLLDQSRLFFKGQMPFAFVTWARVSDDVHARLMSGNAKLAPHEWTSGAHLWLIDVIVPFGGLPEILEEVQATHFSGAALRYLRPHPVTQRMEAKLFAAAVPSGPSVAKENDANNATVLQVVH